MEIIDTIKESSTKYFLSSLFGLLILLIGAIYQDILPILYPEIIQKLPKEVFLKITTLAILLFVLSSVLSFIFYLKLKNKLTPKFGVVWDKGKEPYCPNCEKPLKKYTFELDGNITAGIDCAKCNKSFKLITDEGERLTLPEAKTLL